MRCVASGRYRAAEMEARFINSSPPRETKPGLSPNGPCFSGMLKHGSRIAACLNLSSLIPFNYENAEFPWGSDILDVSVILRMSTVSVVLQVCNVG